MFLHFVHSISITNFQAAYLHIIVHNNFAPASNAVQVEREKDYSE